MGILNRVINAVAGWLVMSAGRRAHLAIRVSEASEAQAALELAAKLLRSGDAADAALGKRLRAAVVESAALAWDDDATAAETDLLAEALGGLRPRHAPGANGHASGHVNGNGRAALAAPAPLDPEPDPDVFSLDSDDGEAGVEVDFDALDFGITDDEIEAALTPAPAGGPEGVAGGPAAPPRRKRGRPPKKPGAEAPRGGGSSPPPAPSGPAGSAGEGMLPPQQQQQQQPPPKRPRGRPRKHPRPEDRGGASAPPSPRPASS
jgi:high mobility group AT-hook protein 2